MRIMKLVTLAAVAVVAVACDGISPTSPDATVSSDDATARVDAKASKAPVQDTACRDIAQVQMRLIPTFAEIKVEAVYVGLTAACTVGPSWNSRPQGRLVPTKDPFIVRVTRTTPPTPVIVTAQAPNGVRGIIRVPQG